MGFQWTTFHVVMIFRIEFSTYDFATDIFDAKVQGNFALIFVKIILYYDTF